MRVLTVIPMIGYRKQFPSFVSMTNFPIGPGYVAASLRAAGHEVFGLNANNQTGFDSAHHMLESLLTRSLYEYQPEMVAIGGLCLDFVFIRDAIEIIRRQRPDTPIVVGGGIITNDAEFVFKALRPDFSIYGEAEEATVHLANMIESGEGNFDQIANIGYWRGGEVVFTKRSFDYCPLDELPFPEYDIFDMDDMLDNYGLATDYFWRASHAYPRPMSLTTARSCPYACTFCVHRATNPPYRVRSTQNIMDELEALYERYEFNTLIIVDELFAAKRSKLNEFCEALLERKEGLGWDFGWWFQTHANVGITKDDLKLAKDAGLSGWTYGLESASPTVLKSMDKRSTPPQIVNAIKLSEEAQVTYGGLFIFGDPAETPETIKESVDFFKEHCVGHNIHKLFVKPYPGSQLYDYCLEKGLISDRLDYYERMDDDIFNMTSMPDELWFPWIEQLLAYEMKAGYGKYVEAHSCVWDPDSMTNPISTQFNVPIWEIRAHCPWCSEEDHCRELLKRPAPAASKLTRGKDRLGMKLKGLSKEYLTAQKAGKSMKERVLSHARKKGRETKLKVQHLVKYKDHPLFETLTPFNENFDAVRSPSTFATSCKNCGRRYFVGINWGEVASENAGGAPRLLASGRLREVSSHEELPITTGLAGLDAHRRPS